MIRPLRCNNSTHVQVEIKTTKAQQDTGLLQKAADYTQAFILGAPLWTCPFASVAQTSLAGCQ